MSDSRVMLIAEARREDIGAVQNRFDESNIRRCPSRFSPNLWRVFQLDAIEAGDEGNFVHITLASGKRFYGLPSTKNFLRQFPFVSDLLPPAITPDTLRLAVDIAVRYDRDAYERPFEFDVLPGFTVLEAGAFQGMLTRWFAEKVGPTGRVIGIEMMPDNFEVMRKNLAADDCKHVTIVGKGVWKENGKMIAKSKGLQRSSLSNISSVEGGTEQEIEVVTLDRVLEEGNVEYIDVAFFSVNGSEFEVLAGFKNGIKKVKRIAIASPYGETDKCKQFLSENGFEIQPHHNSSQISAINRHIA